MPTAGVTPVFRACEVTTGGGDDFTGAIWVQICARSGLITDSADSIFQF